MTAVMTGATGAMTATTTEATGAMIATTGVVDPGCSDER
jgi:hypothetical protein